ncbi:hypothetical protein OAB07_01195 [Candidatus Pelagibacter sp.]|nr:hypothetical protein [Candidatus Pelagibacter sp.]
MIKITKNMAKKVNAYFRNLRFSNYIKFRSPKTKLVNLKLFNKDYLNKDNVLTQIMSNYGSDKGSTHHNYTDFYHFLFENFRSEKLNIFEVGLGSVNPNFSYNMTLLQKYSPLCSLRGWKEYFPNSLIFGADIDTSILANEERIKTFYVDMFSKDIIFLMWKKINQKMNIIIDDGFHSFEANTIFFENSFDYLKDDGIYIIEDVHRNPNIIKRYVDYFNKKKIWWQFVDIKNSNNVRDNCLILIKKL